MRFVLERFIVHFNDLYGELEESFLEEAGRRYFLLYLKPIINGTEKGYMISFNFNKSKQTGVKEIILGGKTLVEAVV